MGLHWSDLNPVHAVQHAIGHLNGLTQDHMGESFYVGTNGIYTGATADQIMSQKLGGYNYGNVGRSNTNAYKANAAGTANKIAQGGMTKDDILKYNIKHPNEIAGDNPTNTTALNTNTAVRSK